jgi:hypothetical protein
MMKRIAIRRKIKARKTTNHQNMMMIMMMINKVKFDFIDLN